MKDGKQTKLLPSFNLFHLFKLTHCSQDPTENNIFYKASSQSWELLLFLLWFYFEHFISQIATT